MSVQRIKGQQRAWAEGRGIAFSKGGYVGNLDDNLYEPLREDSRREFESGAGGELEGKMCALHSSAALVCNFFHYWRYRDVGMVAEACGLSSEHTELRFERAYRKPPGVGGIRPHVDIEFAGRMVRPVAIESKFTEQYGGSRKTLKDEYIRTAGVWGAYSGCEALANRIVDSGEVFEYFDAPQLLKHIVGLKTEYGEGAFELVYLWYELEGEETVKHRGEVERFKSCVVCDLDFCAVTYQEVFERVKLLGTRHVDYIRYMEDRYF